MYGVIRSFVMDGKTMDTKLTECEFSSIFASFVGENGFVRLRVLDMLSLLAREEVICMYSICMMMMCIVRMNRNVLQMLCGYVVLMYVCLSVCMKLLLIYR